MLSSAGVSSLESWAGGARRAPRRRAPAKSVLANGAHCLGNSLLATSYIACPRFMARHLLRADGGANSTGSRVTN